VEEGFKIGTFEIEGDKEIWNIVEKKKDKDGLKISLEILGKEENILTVKFTCNISERLNFCNLPKMNSQGNFIINGHDKVVVFQSVRAPSFYFFANEGIGFYGEIIPFKGP
jgi:DNA-directed RNA polymerase beta subunit